MAKHQALVPSIPPPQKKKGKILTSSKKKEKKQTNKHLKAFLQCLNIGGETRESDEDAIVDLGDSLEIGGDCLKLHTEPSITGDGEAVLPHHSYNCTSIVLEDLHRHQLVTHQ